MRRYSAQRLAPSWDIGRGQVIWSWELICKKTRTGRRNAKTPLPHPCRPDPMPCTELSAPTRRSFWMWVIQGDDDLIPMVDFQSREISMRRRVYWWRKRITMSATKKQPTGIPSQGFKCTRRRGLPERKSVLSFEILYHLIPLKINSLWFCFKDFLFSFERSSCNYDAPVEILSQPTLFWVGGCERPGQRICLQKTNVIKKHILEISQSLFIITVQINTLSSLYLRSTLHVNIEETIHIFHPHIHYRV